MSVVGARTPRRPARVRTVAIWLVLLLLAAPVLAANLCARPVGAAARDATWANVQPLLPELRKVAGGRTFVLVTRPSFGDIGRQLSAYRRGYHEGIASQVIEQNARDAKALMANTDYARFKKAYPDEVLVSRLHARFAGRHPKEFIRIVLHTTSHLLDEHMKELRTRIAKDRDAGLYHREGGTTEELTYIYTDDPAARRAIGMEGVERGVTLETTGDELRRALAADSPLAGRLGDAAVVFLDRVDLDRGQLLEERGRPIIRLPAMTRPHYRQLAQLVHRATATEHVPFNLLPRSAAGAQPWGFDPRKADDYAVAGERLAGKLRAAGFTARSDDAAPAVLAAAIEAEVAAGRRPVLIGEATPDGKAIRLPGTDAVFDPGTLSEAARKATWFIFCNSSESAPAATGFTVVGRIWTRDAGDLVATFGPGARSPNSKQRTDERTEWLVEVAALAGGTTAMGGRLLDVLCFESPDSSTTCPVQPQGDR